MSNSAEVMNAIRSNFKVSGLTLDELGRKMGAKKNARMTAWQFINTTKDPRLSMLLRLCEAMDVRIGTLFTSDIDGLFDERKKFEQDAKVLERLIRKLGAVRITNPQAEKDLLAARECLRATLVILRKLAAA